jgi:hypothetical protein
MKIKWGCSYVAPSSLFLYKRLYKNILTGIEGHHSKTPSLLLEGLHTTPHTLRKLHIITHTYIYS